MTENTINPQTLRALRKAKGWSQADLAQNSRCSKEQIGRIEREKSTQNRRALVERLAAALDTEPDCLCRPLTDVPSPSETTGSKVQLNMRVDSSLRNRLEFVSRLYHVDWSDIVEISPLLFILAAEASLAQRKGRLNDTKVRLEEMAQLSATELPYLWPWPTDFLPTASESRAKNSELIQAEETAIRERKLFEPETPFDGALNYEREHPEYDGLNRLQCVGAPFLAYMAELFLNVKAASPDLPIDFERPGRWDLSFDIEPSYFSQYVDMVDGKVHEDLCLFLSWGDVDFRELCAKRTKLNDQEFKSWLIEAHARVVEEAKNEAANSEALDLAL